MTYVPSRLSQEQVAPRGLTRHTAAPAEVLGSKVWSKGMLVREPVSWSYLCQGLLSVSLLGSWAEKRLFYTESVSLGALPSQFLDLVKPGKYCGTAEDLSWEEGLRI